MLPEKMTLLSDFKLNWIGDIQFAYLNKVRVILKKVGGSITLSKLALISLIKTDKILKVDENWIWLFVNGQS